VQAITAGPVLVTGATGFTGGRLVEHLVREGHDVRALVRDPNRGGHLRRQGVQVFQGDLRERSSLEAALSDVATVYHVAALFRKGHATREELWRTNVDGTRNLLEVAARAGVERFVHCSTVGVHGATRNGPADEESPFAPGDAYEKSKAEAESIVARYSTEGRVPCVVCRPSGIYGPGDTRFLKLVRAVAKGVFVMVGSGEVRLQLIYVDDLVDGILRCGRLAGAVHRAYILAGPEAVTVNELTRTVAEVLDVAPPRLRVPFAPVYAAALVCELGCRPFGLKPAIFRRRVDFFRKPRVFDISKARQELGFDPKVNVRTGMDRTVTWYRNHGHLAS
jgi:nucleoside-diphosphate-sugar epimerase